MTHPESHLSFAVLCDATGTIIDVIHNNGEYRNYLLPGGPLTPILSYDGIKRFLEFLMKLQEQKAVFDWEIATQTGQQFRILYFAGVLVKNELSIVGATSEANSKRFRDEIRTLREDNFRNQSLSFSENSFGKRPLPQDKSRLYEDLSRMNNELVNIRRELHKKNVELQKLNKTKNQFLGMAAHDIRNPLNTILLCIEFLLTCSDRELPKKYQVMLSRMESQCDSLLTLINDLLDYSKIEAGILDLHSDNVNLIDFIHENVSFNRLLAEKKEISLDFAHCQDRVDLTLDKSKIDQVLNNLITNAIKFSYPKSKIIIQVKIHTNEVVISVNNKGNGIPKEEIQKLFKPFSTTSVQSTCGEKNTGLGLAICQKIITMHNGRIWVESNLNENTIFYVSLPRT